MTSTYNRSVSWISVRGFLARLIPSLTLMFVTVMPSMAADFYWVTAAGEWNDTDVGGTSLSNWSLTPGGSPTGSFPDDSGDTATIDTGGVLMDGDTITTGDLDITGSSGSLTILGVPGISSFLTVSNDFNNNGTLTFDSTGNGGSRLTVSGGTLTNTGTIRLKFGTGISHTRTITAHVQNQDTLEIEANTIAQFNKSFGAITNTDSFNVAAGAEATFGTSSVFTQAGGTLNNQGTFTLSSDTFDFNGGTVTANPPVILNSALNIGPSSTGAATFEVRGLASTLSGDVAVAQTLNVQGINGLSAVGTAATSFTNRGRVNLDGTGNGGATLKLTSGTLTNAGGAELNFKATTATARTLQANLLNDGTVNIDKDTAFSKASALTTNRSLINISSGAKLTFATNSTFTQAGGTHQ